MCCRTCVSGLPESWPLILEIAGFKPVDAGLSKFGLYRREIGEIWINADHLPDEDRIRFHLYPGIGSHSYEQHLSGARAASVIFKTAMTLAERSNGEIVQEALVGDCLTENGVRDRTLAVYPTIPLTFSRLCFQFRQILESGLVQLGGGKDAEPRASD